MKIRLLGTASGVPVPNRRHSSLLIETGERSFLLDAGEGAGVAVLEAGAINEVEEIFISHTHADHVGGLPLLLQLMHLRGRSRAMTIFCPPPRCDWLVRTLEGMYITMEKWSFPFVIRPLPGRGGPVAHTGGWISCFPTRHLNGGSGSESNDGREQESYGFIIGEGRFRTIFSSDITTLDEVRDHCAGAVMLVTECTHVALSSIFALADELPNLHIVVTHIPPEIESQIPSWEDQAMREYGSRITFAFDGCLIDLES